MSANVERNNNRKTAAAIIGLIFTGLVVLGIAGFGDRMNLTFATHAQEETKASSASASRLITGPGCSNATLAGRYAVIGDGFVPSGPPPAAMVPFATVGIMTMDGSGNLSNNVTVSNNGQIFRNVNPGTYNVNADCKGTMTIDIPNPPFQLTFDLAVAALQGRQGVEFYFIGTTPSVVTHIAKRID